MGLSYPSYPPAGKGELYARVWELSVESFSLRSWLVEETTCIAFPGNPSFGSDGPFPTEDGSVRFVFLGWRAHL